MSGLSADSINYVSDHARRLDPDRHFVGMLAPSRCRVHLMTLIALSAEIGSIRASVSEPMIGQMKFAWWRNVLSDLADGQAPPKGHPLSEAVGVLLAETPVTVQLLNALVDSREAELLDQDVSTASALQGHVKATAVPLMEGVASVLAASAVPQPVQELAELHGMVRAMAAFAVETNATGTPPSGEAVFEEGMDLVARSMDRCSVELKTWPKALRPLLPLYVLSVRRAALLKTTHDGAKALALRPPVLASLLAVWTGRV